MRGAFAAAALLLGLLAPGTEEDALLKDLREGDAAARKKAVYALFQKGPAMREGLDVLVAALRDPDPYVADVAGRVLDRWGAAAGKAADDIALALEDERPKVRATAARLLGKVGEPGKDSAPALLDRLEDEDADVRLAATTSIGTLGYFLGQVSFGQQAAAGLGQTLADPDPRVREAAAFALCSYGETARFALDGLLEGLGDGNARVRAFVINALWLLGPIAEPALDRLYGLLADPDDLVRGRAYGAIAAIGPKDLRLDGAMRRGIKDGNGEIRMGSSWYVANLPALGPEEIALLLTLAADPAPSVRQNALKGLGRVRPPSKAVLEAIARALGDGDSGTRSAAASASGELGEAAAHLVPLLVAMLRDTEDFNDRVACTALGQIGPAAAEATPDLRRRWLRRKDGGERANAGATLARVSPADRPAVMAVMLASIRETAGELPKKDAIMGLGLMGPDGAEGVPLLRPLLPSKDLGVRMTTVWSLGRIGPPAMEAIPDLEALLKDPDERTRQRVREAIDLIRGGK
jgi:HEAT repeat protein